jgi:iron complex transport system substrate-binding protein
MVVLDFLREKGKRTMDRSAQQAPLSSQGRGLSLARRVGPLLVTCALLFGCAIQRPVSTPTPSPTLTPTPSSTPATAEAWPRTVVDDEGTSLELPTQPQRLISLSPANTEIVFALGAGERLLAGTDYDDYPPEAASLADVATFSGVIIEKVVDLEPDLVLAAGNNFTPAGDIDRLRELGIPVLVVYAESVKAVLADISLIGTAIGAQTEADGLTATMSSRIEEVADAVEDLDRPRVFYQLGSEPEIYGPAPDSFIAHMIELAGGEPITTTDPAVFSISVERLVDLDPQVILVGDALFGVCPAQVISRPAWARMSAVTEGAVREVDDTIITRPGPRLAEGLAALALAIHPTADIAPPITSPPICPTSL